MAMSSARRRSSTEYMAAHDEAGFLYYGLMGVRDKAKTLAKN